MRLMPDPLPINIPLPSATYPVIQNPVAVADPIPLQPASIVPSAPPLIEIQPVTNKKFPLIWVVLGIAVLILGVGGTIAFALVNNQEKSRQITESGNLFSDSPIEPTITPWVYSTPIPTPLPKTIAPSGTPEFKLKNYRQERATIDEARAVQARIGATFGNIIISDESIFAHSEVYKGIPIKWTAGQPIPPDRLAWIKAAIDTLPDFFIKDHPVVSFISGSNSELGMTSAANSGAVAYASGLNIFFTNRILKDSILGAATKKDMVSTIFHEYVHIVQHYEVLQTFSEEYLSIPGNLIVVMKIVPFNKDFAKVAGWKFQYDEYGDSSYAILGTDPESQKTTDYGKTSYIEDLADTVAGIVACDTAETSTARIKWVEENFIKQSAASFCPAKF